MKDIWQKILNPGEEVVYKFSIAKSFVGLIQIIAVILIVLVSIFGNWSYIFFLIFVPFISWFFKTTNIYCLTDKRILAFRGFLSTNLISIDYEKITDISATEPFWEKMFCNSGRIAINTAGSDAPEIIFNHISQPYELKKKIDELKQSK